MWRGGAGRRAVDIVLVPLLVLLALLPRAAPDLAADRAALLALRAAVGPHLQWNASSSSSPCAGWRGVRCDASGARVVGLHLPGAGLAGRLPAGPLGNLTALQTLSLRLNALSGPIPADVGGCAQLRAAYLQGNRFDGEIPEGLFQLQLLRRLDLSRNNIAGGVSQGFNTLRRLDTLLLQDNSLNGTLPADLDLPKLQHFNVSNNGQLTGPVPASLAGKPASAFAGTNLCGGPLSPCSNPSAPPSPPPPSPPAPSRPDNDDSKSATKLSAGKIAGIAVGSALALLVLITTLFFLCFRVQHRRSKANKPPETSPNDADTSGSPVTVTVATLQKSGTRRSRSRSSSQARRQLVFVGGEPDAPYNMESLLHASAEVLGKGWLGTTYRATLEGGAAELAIKRLREAPIPERDFRDRAAALGALRHANLAPLRAYFYSREEKLLVYDFVAGRSLCSLLHNHDNNGARSPGRLDFTARVRVALAAARGLAFVHAASARSCHGNVKSSNVLVPDEDDDDGRAALVTDYGLLQLVGAHVPLRRVTGYRAPEVTDPRAVSQEADVYGFGVLLLELLTGRPPANSVPGAADGDVVDLPRWVRTVVQEEWTAEVFDATIAVEERLEEDMVRLLQLATECTERQPDRRPRMDEVAARIEDVVQSAIQKVTDMEDDDFHSISP